MKIDSLLKGIWIAVGSLLLIIILAGIFFALGLNRVFERGRQETGVAIDPGKKEGLEKLTLGLRYGTPGRIAYSPYYLMRVYISYKKNETSIKAGFDSYEKDDAMDVDDPSNIIFLDSALTPLRVLLDKKALLINLSYPHNDYEEDDENFRKNMKYIVYKIVTSDSNENGALDTEDGSDLYLSNLDGSGLFKITTQWTVENYEFLDNYNTLLIRYSKPGEDEEKTFFAKYSITSKEMTSLTGINEALQKIEGILK